MDGLKIGDLTLYLGKLPNRKQHCFYFLEGAMGYVIAYIPDSKLEEAQRLWQRFVDTVSSVGKGRT